MTKGIDLVCFSHLRWDFVYQRPKHFVTQFSNNRRFFYIEEPVFANSLMRLKVRETDDDVYVVVPQLPDGLRSEIAITAVMREMIYKLFLDHAIDDYVFWYYTPMALRFTSNFSPLASVYDCMDELSAFKNAPETLPAFEKDLFRRVDLVFTGGQVLWDAKRNKQSIVDAFPSSNDDTHFSNARN